LAADLLAELVKRALVEDVTVDFLDQAYDEINQSVTA
jgi:hypothetical protein